MGNNLTKKTQTTLGFAGGCIILIVSALLWAQAQHDSLAEGSETEVESLRTEVKQDLVVVNQKLDTLMAKQSADTKEILLLLMDIKDGGTP